MKFQVASRLITSSGSKKKDPKEVCLSEVKTSHSHKTWAEVFSSAAHFYCLQISVQQSRRHKACFPVSYTSRPTCSIAEVLCYWWKKPVIFKACFKY